VRAATLIARVSTAAMALAAHRRLHLAKFFLSHLTYSSLTAGFALTGQLNKFAEALERSIGAQKGFGYKN